MSTNTNHRETVFKAAQKLATGIYGASPAAEAERLDLVAVATLPVEA